MNVRPLSAVLQEKAIKELNEEPNRIAADIQHIREWINKNSHLHARTDDQWILTFLRGCKFSLEKTKAKIDMFYTIRSLCPEFYRNRDPMLPEMQTILNLGLFLPLPNTKSADSPKILLVRIRPFDPIININDMFKMNMMCQEIMMLEDDKFIIAGQIILQDMNEMTLNHMTNLSPSVLKKATTCFFESYPSRYKEQHFINTTSFFETIYALFSPFLTDKFKKRMKVHTSNNLDELYKSIPKYLLPKEYGGEAGTIEELTAQWKKKVESYRDFFLDDEQYKTDETKRPGKPKTSDIVFGLEGSFRKLEVD